MGDMHFQSNLYAPFQSWWPDAPAMAPVVHSKTTYNDFAISPSHSTTVCGSVFLPVTVNSHFLTLDGHCQYFFVWPWQTAFCLLAPVSEQLLLPCCSQLPS